MKTDEAGIFLKWIWPKLRGHIVLDNAEPREVEVVIVNLPLLPDVLLKGPWGLVHACRG